MNDILKSDVETARKFHGCSCFIDYLLCVNDNKEFSNAYKKIYPSDLELKCEQHTTFLDLDIKISDEVFVYKLYDMRDEFHSL